MKKYTNIFKQPIKAAEVRLAVQVVTTRNSASVSLLTRQMRIGFGKAATLIKLLEDAQVITPGGATIPRTVILRQPEAATNAALRQFNKGNK